MTALNCRIAGQARMLMESWVSTQNMICSEEMVVSRLFNRLDKGANRPEIDADFGLGKDGSHFHSGDSLSAIIAIRYPEARCWHSPDPPLVVPQHASPASLPET